MSRRFWRRRYIINPRFQLRWATFLGLVAALGASLFAVPLHESLNQQNGLLRKSLEADQRIYSASQDITILLMNLPETSLETTEEAGEHFDRAHAGLESVKQAKMEMIQRNEATQTLVWLSVPALAILLFIVGIFVTHSVAGPLYVMKRQLETYGVNRKIDERSLRGGDEFLDVYATFYRVLSDDKERRSDDGKSDDPPA